MRTGRAPVIVLLLCAAGVASADPLASPACRRALDALALQEQAMRSEGAKAAWREAQRDAARLCLGASDAASAPRGRLASPALSVPPIPAGLPGGPRSMPAPMPVPPSPPSIASCDPGGCWATDGTRLNRMGSELVGPRGRCRVEAGVVACP